MFMRIIYAVDPYDDDKQAIPGSSSSQVANPSSDVAAYSPYGVPLDLESPYDPTPVVTDAAALRTATESSSSNSQYTTTTLASSAVVAADVTVPAVAVSAGAMSVLSELDRDYQALRQRLLTALVAIEQQQQGQPVPAPVQSASHTPASSPPPVHTTSTPATSPSPYSVDPSTLNTFLDDDDFLTTPISTVASASTELTVSHTNNTTAQINPPPTAPVAMPITADDETALPLPVAPRSYWPPTTAAAMRRTGDSYLTNTDPTIPASLLQDDDERSNTLLSANNKTSNRSVSNSIMGHSVDVTSSSAGVGGAQQQQQQVTAKRKRYWPPSI